MKLIMTKYKLLKDFYTISIVLVFLPAICFAQDVTAIAYDNENNLFAVVDGSIKQYDAKGKEKKSIVSFGSKDNQVIRPLSLVFGTDNIIYAADTGNNRIQVFNKKGEKLFSFGNTNPEEKLSRPSGLVIDSKSNIYCSDTGNNSIRKYDSKGNLLMTFKITDKSDAGLQSPFSLAIDKQDRIYVSDIGNRCIEIFDTQGIFSGKIVSESTDEIPGNIAINSKDEILILDSSRYIRVYDKEGKFIKYFVDKYEFIQPVCIAIDKNDNTAVYDLQNKSVKVFNSSGKQNLEFSLRTDRREHSIRRTSNIFIDNKNQKWIVSTRGSRYAKYDASGKLVGSYGGKGTSEGLFDNPCGIAVDSSGRIFVCDTFNNRVEIFDSNNRYIDSINDLSFPMFITFDKQDNAYISNRGTVSIKKYDKNLKYLGEFKFGDEFSPGDIIVNKDGDICVINTPKHEVLVLSSSGEKKYSFGGYGEEKGKFEVPVSLTSDDNGNIYVYDTGNKKINKFKNGNYVSNYKAGAFFWGFGAIAAKGENMYLFYGDKFIEIPLNEM